MTDHDQTVRNWVEDELGPVVTLRRQPRWRPVWFATVEGLGEVVVRGDRTDMELIFPLDHEMRFQQIAHAHGIPVPAVHGWIDDIPAYVMDVVPGAPYLLGAGERVRATVMREYMTALADLHRLPVDPFVEAGIVRAESPAESGTIGMARYEERYRRAKRFPDPLLEFGLAWLRRNPPESRGREAPITWDSGQFHHADGHLVALLDLELGHIGDPMMDLAAFRMRDTIGGFGDFDELYGWYESASGTTIDVEAIQRHHVAFTLSNRLAFSSELCDPSPGSDLMTNLQWCRETDLFTTEALAEIIGIDLPEIDLPASQPTRARPAQEQLTQILRSLTVDDEYQAYEVRKAFRLSRHIQRSDEIAAELEHQNLNDLAWLLGTRPTDWRAGDAALERFVLQDHGAHDEYLVELFHKRGLRAQALLGPDGSAMATHNQIQPLPQP
ncbi:MAG: phosphotransferase family protein [Acidimicrobiales bacterium]